MLRKPITYLLVASFVLILTGCTLEQRLAKSYVKSGLTDPFYLLEPSVLFKANLKEYEIPGLDTLDAFKKDSLLLENSLFLRTVNDSILIGNFMEGLRGGLKKYEVVVLPEKEVDSLMLNGGHSYIVNIAQFSLEEYIHPYSQEEWIYDEVLVIDGIDLNALNYNVWVELNRLNSEEQIQVLFMSDYLLDEVDGMLKTNLVTGKMSYDYTIDTISDARIYGFARQTGERAAALLFDYLMNSYVSENLPEEYPYEALYYHYDPVRNLLYAIGEEDRIMQIREK
jgi:hypothetical protein